MEVGISSTTTNVQHLPGSWDRSHSVPERPPHTSLNNIWFNSTIKYFFQNRIIYFRDRKKIISYKCIFFYLSGRVMLVVVCFQYILVLSQQCFNITRRRQHNLAKLRPISTSPAVPLSFSVGLWNCQSAFNKLNSGHCFSVYS